MGRYSLKKLKYKNDWKYPVQVRLQEKIEPTNKCPSFQSAIESTIIIGQCFGLNPVLGVCEKDAAKLRFKYRSGRFLYTLITIIGQFAMVCLLILGLFQGSFSTVDSSTVLVFFGLNFVTTILFLRIAMKWPKLCMEISQMEAIDPTTDYKLKIKLNVSTYVILALALLEHILSNLHDIALAMDCEPDNPVYETFVRRNFPWIFDFLPYSHFIGVLFQFINAQCTVNWNFTDVFVICMSIYLATRLEQVNQRVVAAKNKCLSPSFWRTIREDYNKATNLVRKVDKIIGGVIFISFANNLFFICAQLLHSLADSASPTARCKADDTLPDRRLMGGYEHSIYFIYSFVFLVARSLTVSLMASRVHSASLEIAFGLYDCVASTTYCVEIARLIDQIHGNTVALTGLQFFSVNRGLILAVAGTIITYELVLMQFTGVTPTSPSPL